MSKPRLLDLFCCAGGAGEGYRRAGFEIVGCDIAPQKHNPHEFYQGDALQVLDTLLAGETWNGYRLDDFDAVHASPPCQDYTPIKATAILRMRSDKPYSYPRLIVPVREKLRESGLPWILENVRMALVDMENPVMLCGTALGIRVQRHRLFDSSHVLFSPGACNHRPYDVGMYGGSPTFLGTKGGKRKRGNGWRTRPLPATKLDAQAAMGIAWMTLHEMSEAIPPAYTEWLGRQLLTAIEASRAA